MSCEACEKMHLADTVKPHDGLLIVRSPAILRPMGRQPLLLQRYCCRLCNTNWLMESDPLQPDHSDWVCLYLAANILDPVSTFHPRTRSSVSAADAIQAQTPRQLQNEQLAHRFS